MKNLILVFFVLFSFSMFATQFTTKVDKDKDGYVLGIDCDDNDPTVYPGAAEIADGKDNDCDGSAD